MAEVITRVGVAMERLADTHAGRDVVIVSHGGAIRAAIAHALRIGPDNALHMSIQNLSLSRVQRTPGGWRGGLRERAAGVLKVPRAEQM